MSLDEELGNAKTFRQERQIRQEMAFKGLEYRSKQDKLDYSD